VALILKIKSHQLISTFSSTTESYLWREIDDSELFAEFRNEATRQQEDEGASAGQAVQQGLVLTHRFHVGVTLKFTNIIAITKTLLLIELHNN
jgi:hypothetical protein